MNAIFKINNKIINTDRLILRAFKEDDLKAFFEYAKVDGVGEMAGWSHHKDINESKKILDMFINEDKTFALVDKETNKVIGSIGIEEYGNEDKLSEFNNYYGRSIGYALSKSYWGQGLMPEALKAIINYLFNELDFDFLLCAYYDFNNQSKRVQEKCGFLPYRKLNLETRMNITYPGVLNLLTNPNKNITLNFSHPETLIYNSQN